jgi:predicted nucleic acid-binding protein
MPAEEREFADSNIVLYALGKDSRKKQRAWEVLFKRPLISIQVLGECSNTLIKKHKVDKPRVRDTLQDILQFTAVEPIDLSIVERAWAVMERYRFSYFDSLMVATALAADCRKLYSEDLQHGQAIDGQIVVINPFLD